MPVNRPNILLIMVDNQPADLLGCAGNDEIHTPNLDRLAQQGIRFQNAFCVNAMCSPCRASTLTGLMPSQHGIHTWLDDRIMDRWPENWNALAGFRTLPRILQENGYDTALIGKYHLGMPYQPQNGFAHWVTFPLGHTLSFWNNTIIDNGEQTTYPGHSVDGFTEKAVEYIQARHPGSDPPFFLFLTYNAPYGHWPSIRGPARNRFAALYGHTAMRTIPREGLSPQAIERFLLRRGASGGGIDYSAHLQMPNDLPSLRNYFSQVTMVDDGVGRVLAALERQGLDEHTLVIYTADHGFSLGHHGFWGHGQATWPANAHRVAYHVPLLVRQPGRISAGQVSDRLVSQIDLFATLLETVELDRVQTNPNAPSRSFAPLLDGRRLAWQDEVFIEQEEVRAIRTPQWLYMRRFEGSATYPFEDELYDLVGDPGERDNLLADPAYADVAASLRARVEAFFQQYRDPKYDLWQGGTLKSNSDKPWLWKDAWGEGWEPVFA
jgi:arylsulfatase A-like enzyme